MKSVSDLSLEQAPPFRIPLRYFLTAPLFGMAGGLLLLAMGAEALASRWLPGVMGLTHLFTLGFITMAMCGALLQILPVLGGVPVPGVSSVGPVVHVLLIVGTLALVGGFISGEPLDFDVAVIALGGGLALFVGTLALGLTRVRVPNLPTRALWGALAGLLATLILGVYLIQLLVGDGVSADTQWFVDLHLGWALLGWVGLLVVGVGLQVVPLFQMTRDYPRWLAGMSLLGILPIMAVWTWALSAGFGEMRILTEILLALTFSGFAMTTLWLQSTRKRRAPDAGVLYWRTSAASTLFAVALWLGGYWPGSESWAWYPMLWGVAVIGGMAVTVVNGMLYKIVPFLAWFHLQQRQLASSGQTMVSIPHMQELLPVRPVIWQFRLHLAVLILAAGAVFYPEYLARPLGGIMLLSFALLSINLMRAARLYRRTETALSYRRPGADIDP